MILVRTLNIGVAASATGRLILGATNLNLRATEARRAFRLKKIAEGNLSN
jgi:hypothetical protein